MPDAWVFQKVEHVRDMGADDAAWYAGWYEPGGRRKHKSFGAGPRGKKAAEAHKRKVEAELLTGTYQLQTQKLWKDFRGEYEGRILPRLSALSTKETKTALDAFERICKPVRVLAVTTATIDEFIGARRLERGLKQGDLISPATVNKNLRHLRAVLKRAVKWGYLRTLPEFDFLRVARKLVVYVTPEHFGAIYGACDKARRPNTTPGVAPADWWRALLTYIYLTGWRIDECLTLRREDLDLKEGFAVTRSEDNKGNRDDRVFLHPLILEHLERVRSFSPLAFPWPSTLQQLHKEFFKIQAAAGVTLPCAGRHVHTEACHRYGFHDLRRAFATLNARRLTAEDLQRLMRHKSYATTKLYIALADEAREAVDKLFVPQVLRKPAVEGKGGEAATGGG